MRDTIWRRVYRCAQELTRRGKTPFTRRDIIECIQRAHPDCSSDSINPIIQGLTANLRGGAPGAVGKDLLRSVGRGLFVLNDDVGPHQPSPLPGTPVRPMVDSKDPPKVEKHEGRASKPHRPLLSIAGYPFRFICYIEPLRNKDGSIQEFLPQDRYDNVRRLPLNRYGNGPFCKFKIPWILDVGGVYTLVVGYEVRYIGECENLSRRFNMGYGNISPRNCFAGGQETNCRINHLIFNEALNDSKVALWFHETADFKQVEAELRRTGSIPWNRA